MSKFQAVAHRSGHWWAIEVPEEPGVYSQARRIDQIAPMVADALSLWLDRDVPPDDVDVQVHVDDLDKLLLKAREAREEAERAQEVSSEVMRRAARAAVEAGLPVRDVGELLGVSHQRAAVLAREAA